MVVCASVGVVGSCSPPKTTGEVVVWVGVRLDVMPIVLASLLALGGWIVPWQRDAGVATVERSRGEIHDVFLFAGQLDGEGMAVLEGTGTWWADLAVRLRSRGARVWLTLVNDRVVPSGPPVLKDADVVHRILHDSGLRARHRESALALARRLGVDGVDLDYENLPAAERDAFSDFAAELGAGLRAAGLGFSITVQPKRGETTARGPGAMDWPRLCRIADRVQVMLYNEHNASTEPGPIASVEWMSRVVDYALASCPAAKIVPIVKVSGMRWGPEKAEWLTFPAVTGLIDSLAPRLRRERGSRVPWFAYEDAAGRHVVYFEDARSLGAKADRLRARGLTQVVVWSLGAEDPDAIPRLGGQKR
jgi:spore germination protein YaaH